MERTTHNEFDTDQRAPDPAQRDNIPDAETVSTERVSNVGKMYEDAVIQTPFYEEDYARETIVTLGSKRESKMWTPSKMPEWALLRKLCKHEVGHKDGGAIVLGDAVKGERRKAGVKALYWIGLDHDTGKPIKLIEDKLRELGIVCVHYTTHSNAKVETDIVKDRIIKFGDGADVTIELIKRFMLENEAWDLSMVESISDFREDFTKSGPKIFIQHQPIPKTRLIAPLLVPFEVAKEGATHQQGMAKWAKVIEALANLLEIPFDKSCTDPSRLFYLPRHAKGAPFSISIFGGKYLDWRTLVLDEPIEDFVKQANKGKSKSKSVTAEGKALGKWSMKRAHGFQIADVINDHCPEKIRGKATHGFDIECPFDESHSNAGDPDDRACFVVNAGEGSSEFFTISCRHEGCRDKTNLDMLGKMLADGRFDKSVLEDENYNAILEDEEPQPESDEGSAEADSTKTVDELKVEIAALGETPDIAPLQDVLDKIKALADDRVRTMLFAQVELMVKGKPRKDLVAKTRSRKLKPAGASEFTRADYSGSLPLPEGVTLKKSGDIKPTFHNCLLILELAHSDWGFAYDEMAQSPVLRAKKLPWAQDMGCELNDEAFLVIRHFLIEQWGVTFKKEDVADACITLASYIRFNPVIEYLDSLKWDGVKRVETWLTKYLGVADSPYARATGTLWPVAAVRRVKQPGCKFDNQLIFEGPEDSGKSSVFYILGGEHFSDAPLGDVDNKDAAILLGGVWIIEMGELSSMSKATHNAMLAFLSRQTDRYRPVHKGRPIKVPRRIVCGGTTNKDTYLNDADGIRRYWSHKVANKIALDELREDRDQLWAEAVVLEATGMSLVLPDDLKRAARAEQELRVFDDPWREMLEEYLQSREKVHSSELLTDAINMLPGQQKPADSARVRRLMGTFKEWTYKKSLRITTPNPFSKDPKDTKDKVSTGYEKRSSVVV